LAEQEKAVSRIIRSSRRVNAALEFLTPLKWALKFFGKLATKVFKVLAPLEALYHFFVALSKTEDGLLSLVYMLDKMVESITFGLGGLGD